jgi:hypothetical protein
MASAILLVGNLGFWEIVIGLLAFLGAATLLIALFVFVTEDLLPGKFKREFGFDEKAVDRGTPILDYANEDVLRSIASHHNLEGPPTRVERGRKRGLHGGPKSLSGSAENSTTETREPRDDLAELTRRLLGHLHTKGELNQTSDCVQSEELDEPVPFFLQEKSARKFFEDWMAEHFSEGIGGVSEEELARELAKIGRQVPEAKVRELVTKAFEELQSGAERLLFLEGEWSIDDDGTGNLLLTRTDLRITTGNGEIGAHSLPMPSGLSITALLDNNNLTSHGRTRMQGVTQPIRASVIATRRQYHPGNCCFEVAPIAVFQRIDEDD